MTTYPKPTVAYFASLLTAVVGQIVAYAPSFRPDAQLVISAGSVILAAVFTLVSGLVHHNAGTLKQAATTAGALEHAKLAAVATPSPAATPTAAAAPQTSAPPPSPPTQGGPPA